MMGRRNIWRSNRELFPFDERVVKFDKKAVKLEEVRNSGVGGMSMGMILANFFAIFLMIVPMGEMFRELGWFWMLFQGIMMLLGVCLRMQWLFGVVSGGKMVSWKAYLKYVPVDWRKYRWRRVWVLLCYAGKMLLCYVALQVVSQLFAVAVMGAGFHWEEIAYAVLMCAVWILVPGLYMVWRWC